MAHHPAFEDAPRPLVSSAIRTSETSDLPGPSVDSNVHRESIRQDCADPRRRRDDRPHGTQGCVGLRLESLQRLRETTVSLGPDRPDHVLRPVGIRRTDLLHRPIEVPEDPTDFLFEE